MKPIVTLRLAFCLVGCATPYSGPTPNLNLRGAAGLREFHQFELEDQDGLFGRSASLAMGPERKDYTLGSMRPVVEQVSPVAMAELDRATRARQTEILSLTITIASVLGYAFSNDSNTRNLLTLTGLGAGGTALWSSFTVSGAVRSTTKEYNQELKRKLAPRLEASFRF